MKRKERTDEEQRIRYQIATKEIDEGFPRINAHYTAALWNMLDLTLSDTLALILATKPEALTLRALRKVLFSVTDYEELPKTQRMRLAIAELKRALVRKGPAKLKNGVEIYEHILREMGVDELVEKDVAKQLSGDRAKRLSGLRATRNVIVHNMSIVDKRFVAQCPWLQLTPGTELKVTDAQYRDYSQAAGTYLALYVVRLLRRFPESALEPRHAEEG